ncbi:prepilin-type N-terminal cleavage/methylation domain-containing protein [Caldicellulosiruptor changbaiensis]|uniref:Prepilin-type N-terminal cleavage/methylation domain-containing protein n=1 Tax=Caldicellulosiruptor changbaiensis TaxID=1222016 RepID=A0A3T0D783_9FIRM|nr:prepilin-type N-terminal cleavage/methylation domain-containing protein [Caldicellulosiruptor changbaiensis]AZT90859.1 prepilin-type N-terminal cleavage/methylation domain-containing protein [Caldicellulosiruptor changbaiensis]
MKKLKGFTLQELAIVIAILAILLSIAVPNYIAMKKRADVDSIANQFAAMIRELYEKIDSEMEYDTYNSSAGGHMSKYYIRIDNYKIPDPISGERNLKIQLIKFDASASPATETVIKEIVSKTVKLQNASGSSILMDSAGNVATYITFKPDGKILRFTDRVAARNNVEDFSVRNGIEVVPKSGGGYKKTVYLNTVPPGSVEVK